MAIYICRECHRTICTYKTTSYVYPTDCHMGPSPPPCKWVVQSTIPADISMAAREFADEQGTVPTAFAFQRGAEWYKKKIAQQYE
jgi:hypothetical protein